MIRYAELGDKIICEALIWLQLFISPLVYLLLEKGINNFWIIYNVLEAAKTAN